jgi:hypothetical protein
MVNEMNDAAYL